MIRPHIWNFRSTRFVACLALVAVLVGCEHASVTDDEHPHMTDPRLRHPISVGKERVALEVPEHGNDRRDRARSDVDVMRFAHSYKKDGRGPLMISVSAHGDRSRLREVRQLLARTGVSGRRIRTIGAEGDEHHASIVLSYDRFGAIAPECGDWSEDVARNRENLPYPNYGCATQRNLAHMAANPNDLVYAARETPRGSDRRAITRKTFTETPPPPVKLDTR